MSRYTTDEDMRSAFKNRMNDLHLSPEKKKDICQRLGVSMSAVNDWIIPSGSYPSTKKLIELAECLDCSLDYLVGLSDVPSINADIRAINVQTGLSQKSIEVLQFLNTAGEDDDDRHSHHKVIDLINEVLEKSYGQIQRFEETGFPVTNVFTTMSDYLHPGDVTLSSLNLKTKERTEIHGDVGTLEIGQDLHGYTLNELARALMIKRIEKQLIGLKEEK